MSIVLRQLMNFRVLEYKSKPENNFRMRGRIKSAYDVDSRNCSDNESSDDMKAEQQEDLGTSILHLSKNNNKGGYRDYGKSKHDQLPEGMKTIYKTHDHTMLKTIQQDHAKNLSSLLRKSKDPSKLDQSKILKKSVFGKQRVASLEDVQDDDPNSVLVFNVALRTPIDDLGDDPTTTTEFIDGVHSNRTQKHFKDTMEILEFDLLPIKTRNLSTMIEAGGGWSSPIPTTNLSQVNFKFGTLAAKCAIKSNTDVKPDSQPSSPSRQAKYWTGLDCEEQLEPSCRIVIEFIDPPVSPKIERKSVKSKKANEKVATETLVNQLMKQKLKVLVASSQVPDHPPRKLHSRASSGVQMMQGPFMRNDQSKGLIANSPNMTNNMSCILGSQTGQNSSVAELDEKFNLSIAGQSHKPSKRAAAPKESSQKRKKTADDECSPTAKKVLPDNRVKSSNSVALSRSNQQMKTFSNLLESISRKDKDAKDSAAYESPSSVYSPEKKLTRNNPFGHSMNAMNSQQVASFLVSISNNVITTTSKGEITPLMASEASAHQKNLRRLETGSFNFVTDSKNGTPNANPQARTMLTYTEQSQQGSSEQVVIDTQQSPLSPHASGNSSSITRSQYAPFSGAQLSEVVSQTDIRNNKHYQKIFKGLTINPDVEKISHSKVPFVKQKTAFLDSSQSKVLDHSPLKQPSITTKAAMESQKLGKDSLFSNSKRESVNSTQKTLSSSKQIKSFAKVLPTRSHLNINPMTDRPKEPNLSVKRFSKPNLESTVKNNNAMVKVQRSQNVIEKLSRGSQGNLGSPANMTQTEINQSGELPSLNRLSKKVSLDPAGKDLHSSSEASLTMIGHVQSGNQSHTLSSIKHSSTLKSGVFGTNKNLEEFGNFIPPGKTLVDCESLRNLQSQLMLKKQKSGGPTSTTFLLGAMDTIPTESDENTASEFELPIRSLDMITQISKSRLLKGIKSIFERYNLRTSLATMSLSFQVECDCIVWTIPQTKAQLLVRIYDLDLYRYIDYDLTITAAQDHKNHTIPGRKISVPCSFTSLPLQTQNLSNIIMLEIKLLLDQAFGTTE